MKCYYLFITGNENNKICELIMVIMFAVDGEIIIGRSRIRKGCKRSRLWNSFALILLLKPTKCCYKMRDLNIKSIMTIIITDLKTERRDSAEHQTGEDCADRETPPQRRKYSRFTTMVDTKPMNEQK